MRLVALFAASMALGCGIEEAEFVDTYAAALCDHTMACSNTATLTFDGIVSHEDCVELRYNSVGEWGVGCKFKAKPAATCLEDMAVLACPPAEGALAERPVSCDYVYVDCQDLESIIEEQNPEEPVEEPAATDE